MITVYFLDHFARPYNSVTYPVSLDEWRESVDRLGYWNKPIHPNSIPPAIKDCLSVILKEQVYIVLQLQLPKTDKKSDRLTRQNWPGYSKGLKAYMVNNTVGYRIVTGDGVPELYSLLLTPPELTGEFERNPNNK